ncbi:hypothetical protein M3649_04025 [Ureibacillus chungkukjangi]|uniref:hypothetical protein n=1 Tax=Ureibacillus chungkukjangi TaxID=1202712 RepID=UPI00204211FB|nr:hypothetical protein [Ureibacillus chungkukjangi]MCM3387300.1 hypothetical protein [Ureibacillus chungkukjangi]
MDCTNELYFFIEKIKNKLSSEELNEINEIYYNLNSNFNVLDDELREMERLENEVSHLEKHIEENKDEIESIFNNWDDEKEAWQLMEEVQKVLDKEVIAFKLSYEPNYDQQKEEILQLVKRGFIFNDGIGKIIYDNHIDEIQQKEKELLIKKEREKLILNNSSVEKLERNVYKVIAYKIESIVNLNTNKVTGKGSRNNKDALIQRVLFYKEYEEKKVS